jgi:adenine phosphoribosyltransferase
MLTLATSDISSLRSSITEIPNFPKQGILFRDISPLLRSRFNETIEAMIALFSNDEWASIELIGGVESRGFILAAGMAAIQKKGFIKIRKPGKLPEPIVKREYQLEYGTDTLEMHYGTGLMLIIDDILATGGTLAAAADLAEQAGFTVAGLACLVNLKTLNQFVWQNQHARTVIDYVD